MALVIHDVADMQLTAERLRLAGKRLAIVPTMGSLHDGHLHLIRTAKEHAPVVVTTIFVNPAQFGPGEDFDRYPRDLDRDRSMAESAGTDYIFAPRTAAMYPPGFATSVDVERLSTVLEGKSRPGHFRGVATVVVKLYNIVKPHVAVFGQKDAQQVIIVRQIVRDLNFAIDLVVVPTVREPDGLAKSSRNSYLSPLERREAPVLFQSLQTAQQRIRGGEHVSRIIIAEMAELIRHRSSGVIDYISVADGRTLEELPECGGDHPVLISLAVRFGATRLIDNVLLDKESTNG
jgi:pantoate--beta-alanine ligase